MASIKCTQGGTSHTHSSVAEVRACQQPQTAAAPVNTSRVSALIGAGASSIPTSRFAGVGQPVHVPASEKQVAFLRTLVAERVLPQDGSVDALADLGSLSKDAASKAISRMLEQPKREGDAATSKPAAANLPDVPAGHYAVASATGNNDLDFFRVDRPTEGKWAGRTFVKRIVGGHPEYGVRLPNVAGILQRIVDAGTAESARLYGQEIGRCYHCNRTLTDEESRRLGIGPVCREYAL